MTYSGFLKAFIGVKGELVSREGSWVFRQEDHREYLLSEVHEDFVIIYCATNSSFNTIPLSLLRFDYKKPRD
jgi:hypothetical protein